MRPPILTAVPARRWREGVWILLALAGMTLFFVDSLTGTALDPLGVGFILIAASAWAAYILVGQRIGRSLSDSDGLARVKLLAPAPSLLGLLIVAQILGASPGSTLTARR